MFTTWICDKGEVIQLTSNIPPNPLQLRYQPEISHHCSEDAHFAGAGFEVVAEEEGHFVEFGAGEVEAYQDFRHLCEASFDNWGQTPFSLGINTSVSVDLKKRNRCLSAFFYGMLLSNEMR
ncbi:hypothetical protein J7L05_12955 [bacterium]|nr:hypothetical protein [bacterium]